MLTCIAPCTPSVRRVGVGVGVGVGAGMRINPSNAEVGLYLVLVRTSSTPVSKERVIKGKIERERDVHHRGTATASISASLLVLLSALR